jgi:L-ascorbate metabolism protein UlaG (beta-lactamase superfamily)
VLRSLFRRWDAPAALAPASGPEGAPSASALSIRWLGTAAHRLSFAGRTLLLDPFVTRPGLASLVRRLRSDAAALARWTPHADAIVVGHSHYDHLLDAPEIARRTGARIMGSASTALLARAAGVDPALIYQAEPGRRLAETVGPFDVRLVPSLHAKLLFGLAPPFPGEIARARPGRGLYFHQYRVGGAFGVLVRAGDVTVYHNGSADLIDAHLEGERADVLLVGLAGRRWTPRYLERLLGALRPRLVVPTHYDAFFWPLDDGLRLLPGIDLEGFVEEVRRHAPDARVVAPSPFQELRVEDGGRRFSVVPAGAP